MITETNGSISVVSTGTVPTSGRATAPGRSPGRAVVIFLPFLQPWRPAAQRLEDVQRPSQQRPRHHHARLARGLPKEGREAGGAGEGDDAGYGCPHTSVLGDQQQVQTDVH